MSLFGDLVRGLAEGLAELGENDTARRELEMKQRNLEMEKRRLEMEQRRLEMEQRRLDLDRNRTSYSTPVFTETTTSKASRIDNAVKQGKELSKFMDSVKAEEQISRIEAFITRISYSHPNDYYTKIVIKRAKTLVEKIEKYGVDDIRTRVHVDSYNSAVSCFERYAK